MAKIIKRSLTLSGHSTSISLEEPFWIELRRIADARAVSLAALVGEIDVKRLNEERGNLSSALRVFVLEWVQGELGAFVVKAGTSEGPGP